jgi:hypothetical protein
MVLIIGTPIQGGEPANGWRGNGTGLWPDADAPVEWFRIPHGAMEGLRNSATMPADGQTEDAAPVQKGLIRHWQPLKHAAIDCRNGLTDHSSYARFGPSQRSISRTGIPLRRA